MQHAFFIIALFALLNACSADPQPGKISEQAAPETLRSQNFRKYFADVDTTGNEPCVACSGMAYKLVGNSYVLTIRSEIPQLPDLQPVSIDDRNSRFIELWIFNPGEAHLTNVCSDIVLLENGHEPVNPVAFLHPESGEVVVDVDGSKAGAEYTFLVKKLVFRDKSGKKIVLENELFWRVRDLGTPG